MMGSNPYIKKINDFKGLIYTYNCNPLIETKDKFFQDRKYIIDIGCGAGSHIVKSALIDPDLKFIGFEIRFKRLVLAATKSMQANISNVRFIQSKVENLENWLKANTVFSLHCNFPDPWPKKRHRKHRFLNEHTLKVFYRLLTVDGDFQFKTDDSDYFFEVKELIQKGELFTICDYTENLFTSSHYNPTITSEFETLFISKNMPIFFLRARKTSSCPQN